MKGKIGCNGKHLMLSKLNLYACALAHFNRKSGFLRFFCQVNLTIETLLAGNGYNETWAAFV